MAEPNGQPKSISRRGLAFSGLLAGSLLAAAAGAVGTGLGSRGVDWFFGIFESEQAQALVSSSASEEIYECGTLLFVKEPKAEGLVSGSVRTERDWIKFDREHKAVVVAPAQVSVSIQGESSRPVTLTRVDFDVQRRPRPAGAVFSKPCGGPGTGRFLTVDLDRDPPRVVASSVDPKATIGVRDPAVKPITFPWSVSLSDPLLLYITAKTKRCYCTWRAFLTWRSGGKSGRIAVDNGGAGYAVVGDSGGSRVPHYSYGGGNKWVRYEVPSR